MRTFSEILDKGICLSLHFLSHIITPNNLITLILLIVLQYSLTYSVPKIGSHDISEDTHITDITYCTIKIISHTKNIL